jgi:cold-inducible RNA-binding protein
LATVGTPIASSYAQRKMDERTTMTTRLYVGNLSHDATAETLRAAFGLYGDVVDVHVLIDRYSGRPRGFAFVTMASREQAEQAMARMNGTMFEGRPLRVSEAESGPAHATGGPGGPPRDR